MPKLLWGILAVALALRLLGAWCANLTFDERANVALADTIDLHPDHLHLVARSVSHPLLSVYVTKLSGLSFGNSDFGLRLLHVLAGTLTVTAVYHLGRRAFSQRAGLWAAALAAVDQFHASWSRVVLSEVLMLLFCALALLAFLRLLEDGRVRNGALLGVALGLAYLGKEPAVLLIPAMWLYLWLTPEHRPVLRRWSWYVAHAVFLLVVAPDVVWNLLQATDSYFHRDLAYARQGWMISLKPLSLYLGELFRAVIGLHVLDVEYQRGNLYACYWPAGVLYLAGVLVISCRELLGLGGTGVSPVHTSEHGQDARGTRAVIRLLLVLFWLVLVTFVFVPGGERFEPFWWASISWIPAVVCGGWLLDWASRGGPVPMVAAWALVGCLGFHYVPVAQRPGFHEPRATVEDFVKDFLHRATHDKYGVSRDAEHRYIFVLNIGGPNAEAYYGLAELALRQGEVARAERMLRKAVEAGLDAGRAEGLLQEIRWQAVLER